MKLTEFERIEARLNMIDEQVLDLMAQKLYIKYRIDNLFREKDKLIRKAEEESNNES